MNETTLELHLYGKLRRFTPERRPDADSVLHVPVRPGDTVRDLLVRLGVPLEEVGSNIFVNHRYSTLNRAVQPGDRLAVFPDDMQVLYKWYFAPED